MGLVDKHKVKRQRLDRICEGKSQRGWRFLKKDAWPLNQITKDLLTWVGCARLSHTPGARTPSSRSTSFHCQAPSVPCPQLHWTWPSCNKIRPGFWGRGGGQEESGGRVVATRPISSIHLILFCIWKMLYIRTSLLYFLRFLGLYLFSIKIFITMNSKIFPRSLALLLVIYSSPWYLWKCLEVFYSWKGKINTIKI
jgi:hypothetical protein